jgi:hypothetical protein
MAKHPKNDDQIEIVSDAWERFERAVDSVAKGGPQHKASKPAKMSSAPGRGGTKKSPFKKGK